MLVRTPAFVAAFITLLLTYWLAAMLFNKKVGLLSLILLAFWPMAVFSHRQGYLENFITPVFLMGLIAIWQLKKRFSLKWWLVGATCAFIASWTKLAGYIIYGILAYWLTVWKKNKWSLLMLGAGLLSLVAYLMYGQIVGGSHFWWTISQQQGRGAYLASIFTYFSSPQVQGGIKDGWWYIGILSLGYTALNKNIAYRFIGMNAFSWLFIAFFLSGQFNTSPWYIYPIYPFMMICAALMIVD